MIHSENIKSLSTLFISMRQLIHSVSRPILMTVTHVLDTAAATSARPNSRAQVTHPKLIG